MQVGEDFEERNDEICGAVFSTRPRFYRIQLWVRNKDDVTSINAIGQHLLRLLALDPASGSGSGSGSSTPAVTPTSGTFSKAGPGASSAGISLEFAYHSKGAPPHGRFITFSAPHAPVAAPGPSTTNAQGFAGAGSAFGAFGPGAGHGHAAGQASKILTPASSFHRPPGLAVGGGMARTVSMGALGGLAGGLGHAHAHGHGHGHGSTHGGSSLKSGFTVGDGESQHGGVTQNTPPAPVAAIGGGVSETPGRLPSWRERLGQPAKGPRPLAAT